MRDVVGTGHGPRANKGTQVDHIPILVADLETGNVRLIRAGIGFGLQVDPVDPTVLVELVDIHRTQIDLQGVEDIGERNLAGFGLGAIHFQVTLGHRRVKGGVNAGQFRPLAGIHYKIVNRLRKRFDPLIVEILDFKLKAPGCRQARNRRGVGDQHPGLGYFIGLGIHPAHDGFQSCIRCLAFVPGF